MLLIDYGFANWNMSSRMSIFFFEFQYFVPTPLTYLEFRIVSTTRLTKIKQHNKYKNILFIIIK